MSILYKDIYDDFVNKIITKELKPNTKLPSKRALALDLNVSLSTVVSAYELLLDEGFIYSKYKSGYFVSNNIDFELKPTEHIKNEIKENTIKYDFTTRNTINPPSTTLIKITKNILLDNSYLNKTEFQGDYGLRLAISEHLSLNRGIKASPDNIFITSGIESLRNVIRILNIDNITLENPGYHKLAKMANNLGLKVYYQDLDDNGIKVPNHKTIIYSTTFNQFPTGIKMSLERKNELAKFLNDSNSYLIEDDFDAEFRIKGSKTIPMFSISDNVIFSSTFSEILYSGLRISYFILPNKLKDIYIKHYDSYSTTVPTLEQLILRDYINDGYYAKLINKRKNDFIKKRNLISEILDKNNIRYDKNKNYLSMLINIDNIDENKLLKNLKEKGILIETINNYDINKKSNKVLILGYTALNMIDLENGLNIIIEELKK